MIRTGIFGGSFNPIHKAHVELARKILNQLQLDEVWLMVSPQNPLKQQSELLGDKERLRMAEAAVRNEAHIKASNYEMRLPKPSYTWNTLQHLMKDFPDREFTLIIGADNWLVFPKWYHHDDILHNANIAIYPREGYDIDPLSLPTNVSLLDMPLITMSSTEIRQRIRQEKSIKEYVLPEVAELIKKENWYV